jgi:hypothetical protein
MASLEEVKGVRGEIKLGDMRIVSRKRDIFFYTLLFNLQYRLLLLMIDSRQFINQSTTLRKKTTIRARKRKVVKNVYAADIF